MNSLLSGVRNSLTNIGQVWNRLGLLSSLNLNQAQINAQQERSVIYYTHSRGKFRSNRAVTRRFFRLNWGAWIRPRAGRHKHLWRKPYNIRWWAKQHVFCTEEQNKVLEQMVSEKFKRPLYFVDDPYEPYHKRSKDFVYVPLGKNRTSTSYINLLPERD